MVLTDFKNKIEIKDPEDNATLVTENLTANKIAGFRVGVNGPEYKEYTDTTWKKIIDPEVVGIFLGGVPLFEDLPVTVDDAEIIWPGKKISVDDYCIVNKDETHEDDPA
ncbi:MAG: hypothetical protein LBB45_09040, partial [Methanobrevibacter sp.]|nr:hypothetical protein [Candidatus Methanovirga basalitermitum]